jgi:hypothetical protein
MREGTDLGFYMGLVKILEMVRLNLEKRLSVVSEKVSENLFNARLLLVCASRCCLGRIDHVGSSGIRSFDRTHASELRACCFEATPSL